MFKSICLMAALMFSLTTLEATAVEIKDPENTLVIELKSGEVVIEMLPDVAPLHVERIKTLAREGAYDGVAFHRVIEGFMAQTGDVEFGDMNDGFNAGRAGTGSSKYPSCGRRSRSRWGNASRHNAQIWVTSARPVQSSQLLRTAEIIWLSRVSSPVSVTLR